LVSLDDFSEGDIIEITWDEGDKPSICRVVRIERGFIVSIDIHTQEQVVARPHSPYKIEKTKIQ
jgi:hypothetical protein